ncbi:lipopolysaccharide core heptose(II) kinase RfaY [Tatumella citrea]|uniref:Lipopolysaccharide core heptose(II) kinase RfaY n=1 Tax=Tatumella citrea TaxID=53336 RepID=A0A1Y0L9R9_TATCI|nr:lipopolysaccharide core heptose(II) kinase RfaY [Tatumella citrea]ARU94399.1 hypothetical protein A7K98_11850 [Tatumella citrea]ARU98438.1 hypothetical protein A7K99_11845 [Tatumella citrea]
MLINKTKSFGYDIYFTEEGAIFHDLIFSDNFERFVVKKFPSGNALRDVYLVRYISKYFIVKRDREIDGRLEKRLQNFIYSSANLRLMRYLNKGRDWLLNYTPNVYFIAEKRKFRQCVDSYAVFEFIDGSSIGEINHSNISNVSDCISALHKGGLSSNDIHAGNFIVSSEGQLKVIDLSFKGSLAMCKANDTLILESKYQVKAARKTFYYYLIKIRNNLRSLSRKVRGKS